MSKLLRQVGTCAALLIVFNLFSPAFGSVAWNLTSSTANEAFENPANWVASTYDPPAASPELTPPGSDSVWFIDDYDGTIVLSDERTGLNGSTKLGPGRIGGGDADQSVTLFIDNDVTITGQERDETGAVNPDLREMRVGGEDTVPGDSLFPLAQVIQRAGHFNMEYSTDPLDSDLKIVSDKLASGGAVWEVGGTAELTVNEGLLVGEKTGVVSTGGVFRVRGSNVAGVSIGGEPGVAPQGQGRMLFLSRTSEWDLTDVNLGGFDFKQVNRGKSIAEFVLDAGGVTPIEINGDLALGSEVIDLGTLTSFVIPGFLRVKISEPTTAGSGLTGSGNEQVLFRADNIGSRITAFAGSQSQAGVFFDPDRAQSNFPHRVIERPVDTLANPGAVGTVISDYAGVTYTWDVVYNDNNDGLGVIEDAVTLTNLVISDPGGSGIQGDFDDANGLDPADADALQAAFGTSIGFADAQHMFDLNADGAINELDLVQLITHSGFADTTLTDFDLDGDTDSDDATAIFDNVGTTSGALFTDGDSDLDGDVDFADYMNYLRGFTGPGVLASAAVVPEPTSLALLGLTFGCVLLRRSRS